MEEGGGPRDASSRRRIEYRRSAWSVREFSVESGGELCRAAALLARDWALVWVGDGLARLGELALALGGVASALLAGEGAAPALAGRLSAALRRPVYVGCGAAFDRFTLPLVERALFDQISRYADCLLDR